MSGTAGTFTASTGTVNFNAAIAQAISPFAYTFNNVQLSGSGAKTTTNATINGILSMEGTATTTGTPTYGAAATLQYKGSGAQTTGTELQATVPNLTINIAGGVTLNSSPVVSGTPGLEWPVNGSLLADARDGACSSSTLREASSWGKVDTTFEQMVYAEATTVVPLIVSYVYHSRAWEKREAKEWNKLFA